MRTTTALLLLLCACAPMSSADREQLAGCQQRASLYFEGDDLPRALDQAERGLEVDPDDYKLNTIKGAVLLRASGTDKQLLDQATEVLERVYDYRSPSRHEPYVLLYYSLAEQKQGLRRLAEAIRLEDQASRTPERRDELATAAGEQRAAADTRLAHADELLGHLIDRGEMLRVAHKHRLQIAWQRGQDQQFEDSVAAFLERSKQELGTVQKQIENTPVPEFETERKQLRLQLREEELEVRALYADWCYHRNRFADALAELDRVLELDPKRSNDYYNRGRVLLELGQEERARADFQRFLATSKLPASSEKVAFASRALRQ